MGGLRPRELAELRILQGAGIFRGGFTEEAALAVLFAPGETGARAVREVLDAFWKRGMLRATEKDGGRRYELQLGGEGEDAEPGVEARPEAEVPARYVRFYAGLAQRGRECLRGRRVVEGLDRLLADRGNLSHAASLGLAGISPEEGVIITLALDECLAATDHLLRRPEPLAHAVSCTQDHPGLARVDLLCTLSLVREHLGQWEAASTLGLQAIQEAEALADPAARALALHRWGEQLFLRGQVEVAGSCFASCEELWRELQDPYYLALAFLARGNICAWEGDLDSAEFSYGRALGLGRDLDSHRLLALTLMRQGGILRQRGEYQEAQRLLHTAIREALASKDRGALICTLRHLFILHRQQGQLERAQDCLRWAADEARDHGYQVELAGILSNQGVLKADRGLLREALDCFAESERLHRQLGHPRGVASNLSNSFAILMDLREHERALGCARDASGMYERLQDLRGLTLARLHEGEAAECLARPEEALESFRLGVLAAQEAGDGFLQAIANGAVGRVLLASRRLVEAREALARASTSLDRMGLQANPEYLRCNARLASVEAQLGYPTRARELAARTLAQREDQDDGVADLRTEEALQTLRRLAGTGEGAGAATG